MIANLAGSQWRVPEEPIESLPIYNPASGQVIEQVPMSGSALTSSGSRWKGSFYGDLHVHGTDGIEFYTRKKVVVTRW